MQSIDFRYVPILSEYLRPFRDPIEPYRRYNEVYEKMVADLVERPMADQIAELNGLGIAKAVVSASDAESTWGRKLSNERVAALVDAHPDFLIGFAGVDPHKGAEAVTELEHAIQALKLSGLSLDPFIQRLATNDRMYYPLYAKAEELGIPVSVHASIHFDLSCPMNVSHPLNLDQVAIDFPSLRIIARHGGFPWILEMVAVAWRHRNVYIELSGISPRFLHPDLLRHVDSVLRSQVIFGTGLPGAHERYLAELESLPLRPATREGVLWRNGARLLQLD